MITQSQAEDISMFRPEITGVRETQSKKYKSEFEKDILRIQEAIFLWQIWELKYKKGQKMRIIIDRGENGLRKASAVVLGDYNRYVLLGIGTGSGNGWQKRITLLKADILRGHMGEVGQTKGALRIELY